MLHQLNITCYVKHDLARQRDWNKLVDIFPAFIPIYFCTGFICKDLEKSVRLINTRQGMGIHRNNPLWGGFCSYKCWHIMGQQLSPPPHLFFPLFFVALVFFVTNLLFLKSRQKEAGSWGWEIKESLSAPPPLPWYQSDSRGSSLGAAVRWRRNPGAWLCVHLCVDNPGLICFFLPPSPERGGVPASEQY